MSVCETAEPITLSEKENMSLPRQHASKHLLLLGRETSFTITTAEHYPNANVLLCFYEFASHTRPTPVRVSMCVRFQHSELEARVVLPRSVA